MSKWQFLFSFVFIIMSCGAHHSRAIGPIQAKLYVAGNEPFVQLMAELPDGQVYVVDPQSPQFQRLWRMQGHTIMIVEGQLQRNKPRTTVLIRQFKTNRED